MRPKGVEVLSNAALAATSIVCVACPTARVKSTRAAGRTWSSIFVFTMVSNPANATLRIPDFTGHIPTSLGIRYGKRDAQQSDE